MFEEIKMKRYQPAFKQVIKEDAEEDKSIKMIKDLIDLNWEKDEDAQHQALAMVKGLVLADTKSADKFLTDLSTYTSKMNIEDYSGKQEEGCKKKPKKKGMKESVTGINNILSAQEAINLGIQFIASKLAFRDQRLYSNISFGIYNGIINSIDPELYEDVPGLAKIVVSKVCRALKERV
jgi:hypothetical protein